MTQAIFLHRETYFWANIKKHIENKKVSKATEMQFHSNPTPIFPSEGTMGALHWYPP